ncbi:MAG: epoxyqueuosine reductase QueH [Spirochaetales bacterium]|nr:epoxyqueuosine reductase QueH [Candidatus Physcosoma equi]
MERHILVHVCCGPCATSSILRLLEEGWTPVLFFSDSNIYPYEEFEKRYENLLIVAEKHHLEVLKDSWDHEEWLEWVKGLEGEKEGGARCTRCFRFNLLRASRKAQELGIEHFCTTLTVSRFKNSARIFSQGEDLPGFEKIDFKKKDGFAKSCQAAKELGLYRQHYCGCEFSLASSKAYTETNTEN